ncbi:MAG: adenylyl-sulfate kinase [Solirubrobacteraceae bacterium]|nr:adenylyl-sulfate kinase [Solirubrobacteraceae bacterium]
MAATDVTSPPPSTVAPPVDLLRIATAGSVDDGKSTLLGRLLHDSKAIFADQLDQVRAVSQRRGSGQELDLALVTDGLRAEREQGITIDVAYRYFATPRRRFILADTPGHVRYTRNMVTGASTADVAVLLVDARIGVVEQTRRHATIASLLGIPHIVVAVNKMDVAGWSESAFEAVVEDFTLFSDGLAFRDVHHIPVSALLGDNVVERSANTPWYRGAPLLGHLEDIDVAALRSGPGPARFPVQWVIRTQDYRGYAGQIAGGSLRAGDDVLILPSGDRSRVAAIDRLDGEDGALTPPLSATIRLEDDLDVARGDLICHPHDAPPVSRDVTATLCWMSEEPLHVGRPYLIRHGTREARAVVEDVRGRLDVTTMELDGTAATLDLNEIGHVHVRTSAPLTPDPYAENRTMGSFILVDLQTRDTVAAGMITEAAPPPRSANVVWERGELTRERRWSSLHTSGACVWLTGLPASGKSTLGAAIEARLVGSGRLAYRLDGDNLRHGINGDLGFGAADRSENVRRTAHVAQLLADAGAVVIVSLVSPTSADREQARRVLEGEGLRFVEVWLDTPQDECERRDPKGLYARARKGEIPHFTGVGQPYEVPEHPDLVVRPADSLDAAVEEVLAALGD